MDRTEGGRGKAENRAKRDVCTWILLLIAERVFLEVDRAGQGWGRKRRGMREREREMINRKENVRVSE